MENFYSRRERKALAKALGLRKKDETFTEWCERTRRARAAGKQLHQSFVNEVETRNRNLRAEKDAKQLQWFTERVGHERANAIMAENQRIENARTAKRAKTRK